MLPIIGLEGIQLQWPGVWLQGVPRTELLSCKLEEFGSTLGAVRQNRNSSNKGPKSGFWCTILT